MSVWLSPLAANIALSWFKLKLGLGSLPVTLEAVELNPSSLPNSTEYAGPPANADVIRKKNIIGF